MILSGVGAAVLLSRAERFMSLGKKMAVTQKKREPPSPGQVSPIMGRLLGVCHRIQALSSQDLLSLRNCYLKLLAPRSFAGRRIAEMR